MRFNNRIKVTADEKDLEQLQRIYDAITYRVPDDLLGDENSNTKLKKNGGGEFKTFGLSFAPATLNGLVNLCPGASDGCMGACLFSAGRGVMRPVIAGRLNRVFYMLKDTDGFIKQLQREITNKIKNAKRNGNTAVIRLNVISDLAWEKGIDSLPLVGVKGKMHIDLKPEGYNSFPEMIIALGGIVYDYTKRGSRLNKAAEYSLTFSRSEVNNVAVMRAARKGKNIAVVFKLPDGVKELPAYYKGIPVVDGDKTDLRFLDPKGVIVGLKAKGKARKDSSGFVVKLTESDYKQPKSELAKIA